MKDEFLGEVEKAVFGCTTTLLCKHSKFVSVVCRLSGREMEMMHWFVLSLWYALDGLWCLKQMNALELLSSNSFP